MFSKYGNIILIKENEQVKIDFNNSSFNSVNSLFDILNDAKELNRLTLCTPK